LVAFGNVVGRGPHFVVESDRHALNLFVTLVGQSAKARKGTSWGHIRRRFEAMDPLWGKRIVSGLSSGEGLIWAVRDGNPDAAISPIEDKRLLVMEPEFAAVLRVLGRDGNTLSAQIRQAWDGGELHVLTKNCPVHATDAHISLISHVSQLDLKRYLTSTEAGNGFANRFLWLHVSRSKLLPEGGCIDKADLSRLDKQLSGAVAFAREVGEMKRDERARELWRHVYPGLTADRPGLFGAVTSRAEAQTTRLACIYALLDKSATVREEHLKAALALWRYSEASAQYIFGTALGHPIADDLLSYLKANANGLSRTEISYHFGRHRRAEEISEALSALESQGLVDVRREETGGRPSEHWVAVLSAKEAK
jgi:hypothetical protein